MAYHPSLLHIILALLIHPFINHIPQAMKIVWNTADAPKMNE
jgi:hypothetical protein